MPNHVHSLIQVLPGHPLDKTVKTWKAYSAATINRLLGKTGALWAPDYFDRMIRDEKHFHDCATYIEFNPVKAGLCMRPEDWRFGSAFARAQHLGSGSMRV